MFMSARAFTSQVNYSYVIGSFFKSCIVYSTTKNVLYAIIILTYTGLCSQMEISGGAASILIAKRVSRDVHVVKYY
jgi:hypothetical protein